MPERIGTIFLTNESISSKVWVCHILQWQLFLSASAIVPKKSAAVLIVLLKNIAGSNGKEFIQNNMNNFMLL